MTEALEPRSLPRLSVVLCSLNGAPGVERCLRSLRRQTVADQLQVVVVDDGSSDGTAAVAESFGVTVLRHERNRGLAAARNTGVRAAVAPIVAFLDDDCEAMPDWAEKLLAAHAAAVGPVIGVGGPIVVEAPAGFLRGYLARHNPLVPLEMDLAADPRVVYRFWRYLARNWSFEAPSAKRPVFSFAGANMSFRREELATVGFDESMTFGSEDLDACIRLREEFGPDVLIFEPDARVVHHFQPDIRDTLRRSRAYGRGHARMLRKYPSMRPTVFPLPIASTFLLAIGLRHRRALVAAALLPHVLHPQGLRMALAGQPAAFLDAYVSGVQEAAFLLGAFASRLRVQSGAETRRSVGTR